MSAAPEVRPAPPSADAPAARPAGSNVVRLAPARPLPEIRDREFLPAALEILETPPSPVRIGLLVAICAFVATALAWSYVGRIEIYAVAQGKVQPTGRVKVIQPLEPGKVSAIRVEEGQRVAAGDVLVELDPTETQADQTAMMQELTTAKAEIARLGAAVKAVRAGALQPPPAIPWAADIPRATRLREEAVLAADLAQLASTLANLDAQKRQREAERARLAASIAAQKALIATLRERVDMREELMRRQAGTKSGLIDAMQDVRQAETTFASQQGQIAEAEAAARVLDSEMVRARDAFLSDATRKLAAAEVRADEATQKLAKTAARSARTQLAAPIAGTVQALGVTTVGQVVTTGQELLRLVPEDAALELQVYVQNKDIGFVQVGQEVTIKVDAFPFTRYGTLPGKVVRVAKDAISGTEAARAQADPARMGRPESAAQAEGSGGLVFPAIVMPEQTAMWVHGRQVPLSPGMSVTVEIKTGDRRVIDYLFSPLVDVGSRAMRER